MHKSSGMRIGQHSYITGALIVVCEHHSVVTGVVVGWGSINRSLVLLSYVFLVTDDTMVSGDFKFLKSCGTFVLEELQFCKSENHCCHACDLGWFPFAILC